MTDLSQEEIDRFEEQLEDTDAKALLIEQTAALRGIYQQLQLLNSQLEVSEPTEKDIYRCGKCQEKVPEDERDKHAQQQHNAPPDLSVEHIYEPI